MGILLPYDLPAIPAAPGKIVLAQPDGEKITVRMWGDENHHGYETLTGRSIVQDPVSKQWCYGVMGWDNTIVSSDVRVANSANKAGLEHGFEAHLGRHAASSAASITPPKMQNTKESAAFILPPMGAANISVILANFSDTLTSNTPDQFNALLFGSGNNSMADYFKEVSYNKFSVTAGPGGIGGWYTVSNTHNYYGTNDRYTTNDACPAGGFIKVNDYTIQPERLWGGMSTVGVFAHEYAHSLGLSDLHDTDYTSEGAGNWSLMAGGSWAYLSIPGDRPSHLDPWNKYKSGWITPMRVSGTLNNQPIEAANLAADVYELLPGSPSSGDEYFLVENRQKAGFDAGLPGSGLLIWHVDEDILENTYECYPGGPSCASQHYHVALLQSDNLWQLEKNQNRPRWFRRFTPIVTIRQPMPIWAFRQPTMMSIIWDRMGSCRMLAHYLIGC